MHLVHKGSIHQEMDRLRDLDRHHQRVNAIHLQSPALRTKTKIGSLDLIHDDRYKKLQAPKSNYKKDCKCVECCNSLRLAV